MQLVGDDHERGGIRLGRCLEAVQDAAQRRVVVDHAAPVPVELEQLPDASPVCHKGFDEFRICNFGVGMTPLQGCIAEAYGLCACVL